MRSGPPHVGVAVVVGVASEALQSPIHGGTGVRRTGEKATQLLVARRWDKDADGDRDEALQRESVETIAEGHPLAEKSDQRDEGPRTV